MAKYTLPLKKRPVDDGTFTAPISIVRGFVQREDTAGLVEFFKGVLDLPTEIHDKDNLIQIINWVPQGGISVSEQAKWLDLARKVNRVKTDAESSVVLYGWEADLIWKRVTDKEYKVRLFSVPFHEFLADFCAVTGNKFKNDPAVDSDEE